MKTGQYLDIEENIDILVLLGGGMIGGGGEEKYRFFIPKFRPLCIISLCQRFGRLSAREMLEKEPPF
jgi:hypothetical protein